ncbi:MULTISPECIES: PAS domain-containing sensor histidine kinase [unclassified Shewanella]|uniref:sensor histidine kinase n=1 Tax=unclassified Shewanella TaxID=196818 RepID=UPI000C8170D8|nr:MULTISPECIES: PAS domain-containing sensor histidine kinase [unclassified Shewanella]MDO6618601.1 PAS domain-containing sensor histidine kinase [Shewanella sp. 6_MG-2023]MDO6678516.1 PAS domain-containing sensor histidine kinase [Shewanella sp. 4_MG-2023]MDO6774742.1 PAS domain-containing sensor histidine kinase [Shewanella sp. 3_MG-2023]
MYSAQSLVEQPQYCDSYKLAEPAAIVSEAPAAPITLRQSVNLDLQAETSRPQKAANMSNQMAHILQAMPSGVVIINGDGIVTLANPVATDLLGRPLQGAKWFDIINRAFSPQDDDGYEVSLKDGRRVKLAITPLSPEPGQLIVLTDLTETRLLQKNLSHLQRLSALGKMVATLAHQVRTPLSAAMLYASNLASPKLNDTAKKRFQGKLVDRLNELERQVNDMLLMARNKQDGAAESTSTADIIEPVLANCEPIVENKQCKLHFIDQTDKHIMANTNALSSAINNLVMNSLEANATEIQIVTGEDEHGINIDVIDNGKGLSKEMQQQVLEPFFTTKSQGTGLGLAVVQTVVRNHGGRLQVTSQPHKGSLIRLSFPMAKDTEQAKKIVEGSHE